MRIKRSSMKQNNDIPDKIMERIRKLMRLKESTTSEGEARAAAAAASRLLKEYNLSLFDIVEELRQRSLQSGGPEHSATRTLSAAIGSATC